MKKILTIKEGNTDCNKCPLGEICTSNCDIVLNLFGVDCQSHNLNTLKIEEENKSIDWEQRKFNLYEKLILSNSNQYNFSDLFSIANRAIVEYKNKSNN